MKKKIAIIAALTMLIMLLMTACGGQDAENGGASDKSGGSGNNEMVTVDTSYGEVEYPAGYEEIVSAEKTAADDSEEYVFYAMLNGEKIKVYTISFSESEVSDKGELIGTTLNGDGETVKIYLLPEEDIVSDDMPDEDKNLVYAAQETLNDVVASLSNWTDFKPAD